MVLRKVMLSGLAFFMCHGCVASPGAKPKEEDSAKRKDVAPEAPLEPAMREIPETGLICSDDNMPYEAELKSGEKAMQAILKIKSEKKEYVLELCKPLSEVKKGSGEEGIYCEAATDEHAYTVKFLPQGFTGQIYFVLLEGGKARTADLGVPCYIKKLEARPNLLPIKKSKPSRCGKPIPPELCDPP